MKAVPHHEKSQHLSHSQASFKSFIMGTTDIGVRAHVVALKAYRVKAVEIQE